MFYTSSNPNCCGVRYLNNLYDQNFKILKGRHSVAEYLSALKNSLIERKFYIAFFAGRQIDNNLWKACIEFGFQEYPRFKNTTGNHISVMYWVHPSARLKPKKKS